MTKIRLYKSVSAPPDIYIYLYTYIYADRNSRVASDSRESSAVRGVLTLSVVELAKMASDVASGAVSTVCDVNSVVSSARSSTGNNQVEEDHDEDNEEPRHSILYPGSLVRERASATPSGLTLHTSEPLVLEKMDVDEHDGMGTLIRDFTGGMFALSDVEKRRLARGKIFCW